MQRLLRELFLQVAAGAAYFAMFEAVKLFHPAPSAFDLTALTIGVPLTACLRRGPIMAIGTFLAGVLCLSTLHPLATALMLSASESGVCAAASWILRRRRFDVRLERPGEFATLLAIVIPLVAMVDSLMASLVLAHDSWSALGVSWLERTTSNLIGATLTTPAALLAMATRPHFRNLRRALEFAALVGGLLVAAMLVPIVKEDGGLLWPVAVCVGMPFVILLVVRFARLGALAVAIALGAALVFGVAIDSGTLELGSEATQRLTTIGLWIMTLVIVAVTMLLGVTMAAHRKEATEVRLVASRLRQVVEAARLGYWQLDEEWCTESVNSRLAAMLGTDEHSLIGTHLLDVVAERGRDDAHEQIAAIERGASDSLELECRRPDGRVAWLLLQVTRLDGGTGSSGAIAAVEDLAERRRAEAERLKLESSMLHAQRLESLGVLAGGLAHDFNNIVMGIRGNAGLLRVTNSAGGTQACADRIDSLCQRAAELVSTLLAYAGKGDFSLERLNVARVVREAIGTPRITVPANARIAVECCDEGLDVNADPHHLRQLIVGIMTNALEALPPSGGTVRVRCKRITAPTNGDGDNGDAPTMAEIEFTDDGCGMGDVTLARVFEPFFSTKGLGRGLGMSAALGIARRLGGTIHVDSRLGTGTTVLVRIPCAGADDSAGDARQRGALSRRPTAILAEPDAALRDLVTAALEIRGFAVVLERDLAGAIAAAEEREPGVVVAHAGQSVLGALDLVRAARVRGCDVPLVLTIEHRDLMVIDATDARTRWLPRPFDVRRLLDGIDEATGIRAVAGV